MANASKGALIVFCINAFGIPLERKSPGGHKQFVQVPKSESFEVEFNSMFCSRQV